MWGTLDQEFSQDWRVMLLLSWLDEMKDKSIKYFDAFEQAAFSEELGSESVLPGVLGSFDMQFEEARAKEQTDSKGNLAGLEVQERPSLGEMVKSNRKKPS